MVRYIPRGSGGWGKFYPLPYFLNNLKTAARSAAKFGIPSLMHQLYAFSANFVKIDWIFYRNNDLLVTLCHAILVQNQTNVQPVVTPLFVKQLEIDIKKTQNFMLYKKAISDFQNFEFFIQNFQKLKILENFG